jgi:TIR domain-containing protein
MSNIFISHRTSDDTLAEKLSIQLSSAGHHVWLDVWNTRLGDSIIERINEGLQGASYVLVCYSSSGITSPWMSREWMSALAQQLNGFGVKIIPVRLSGGSPPAILADIKYADLVKDWDNAISDILKAIR